VQCWQQALKRSTRLRRNLCLETPSAVSLRRLAGIVLADALHQTLPVRAISRDGFSSIPRVLSRPRGRR
jgi:hypothetical protein